MNKPLRHLETGSYQPISHRPLHLPASIGLHEAAARQVRALLSNVGSQPISSVGEQAAAAALARLETRQEGVSADDWAAEVSQDYATLRG